MSWRISRKIVDIARYQRDKIEPGRWQVIDENNIDENEYGKSAGSTEEISNEYQQTEWYNSLTDLQKALLVLWKENRFYASAERRQRKGKRKLTDRQVYAMQVVPLIKKAKVRLKLPESAIVGALRSLPKF